LDDQIEIGQFKDDAVDRFPRPDVILFPEHPEFIDEEHLFDGEGCRFAFEPFFSADGYSSFRFILCARGGFCTISLPE
jgi:hypothetical protein